VPLIASGWFLSGDFQFIRGDSQGMLPRWSDGTVVPVWWLKSRRRELEHARQINDGIGAVFDEARVPYRSTTWARRRCRICWRLRFGNACSSRCGAIGIFDHVGRSAYGEQSVENRVTITITLARCATWCRTSAATAVSGAMEAPVAHFEPEACAMKN